MFQVDFEIRGHMFQIGFEIGFEMFLMLVDMENMA